MAKEQPQLFSTLNHNPIECQAYWVKDQKALCWVLKTGEACCSCLWELLTEWLLVRMVKTGQENQGVEDHQDSIKMTIRKDGESMDLETSGKSLKEVECLIAGTTGMNRTEGMTSERIPEDHKKGDHHLVLGLRIRPIWSQEAEVEGNMVIETWIRVDLVREVPDCKEALCQMSGRDQVFWENIRKRPKDLEEEDQKVLKNVLVPDQISSLMKVSAEMSAGLLKI